MLADTFIVVLCLCALACTRRLRTILRLAVKHSAICFAGATVSAMWGGFRLVEDGPTGEIVAGIAFAIAAILFVGGSLLWQRDRKPKP